MSYKAVIYFEATEDSYEEGEIDVGVNSWELTLTADTKAELREKVLDATYSRWEDLDDDQINAYDNWTEYHTSYLANEDNQGDATKAEIASWKQGRIKLYSVNCHILVSKVTETKATLGEGVFWTPDSSITK